MSTSPPSPHPVQERLPSLLFEEVSSLQDYRAFQSQQGALVQRYRKFEESLTRAEPGTFTTSGFCYSCQSQRDFQVAYPPDPDAARRPTPNWRESMICPVCGLNNRMRACYQFVHRRAAVHAMPRLYLAEQATALYRRFRRRFPGLVGSEYLDEDVAPGTIDERGLRHEDATQLSFSDASFDLYLSFEVFEHVPDYRSAFHEAARVLAPQGALVFTVPFIAGNQETVVRATVNTDGSINYLLPKEIHGDPIRSDGALCFYHFGWDMLDELRAAGFGKVGAYFYLSQDYGYLGGPGMIFCAEK